MSAGSQGRAQEWAGWQSTHKAGAAGDPAPHPAAVLSGVGVSSEWDRPCLHQSPWTLCVTDTSWPQSTRETDSHSLWPTLNLLSLLWRSIWGSRWWHYRTIFPHQFFLCFYPSFPVHFSVLFFVISLLPFYFITKYTTMIHRNLMTKRAKLAKSAPLSTCASYMTSCG